MAVPVRRRASRKSALAGRRLTPIGAYFSRNRSLRSLTFPTLPYRNAHRYARRVVVLLALPWLAGCLGFGGKPEPEATPTARKVALVLGGGAARGFAHVGVIKALEAQGIAPDLIVGTSAGALVGALYAGGMSAFELQKVAIEIEDGQFSDWTLPDRGLFKGEALQNFVNRTLGNRPIEKLPRALAVVATDLASGEAVTFRQGNPGTAVRASAAVPGIFQPTRINGRDYVDGGLVSPVPVRIARELGADFVIAVDISARPKDGKTGSSVEVLLQTFAIMGQTLGRHETATADVVIRPTTADLTQTDFSSRHRAVLEGERAAALVLPDLKRKLDVRRGKE